MLCRVSQIRKKIDLNFQTGLKVSTFVPIGKISSSHLFSFGFTNIPMA